MRSKMNRVVDVLNPAVAIFLVHRHPKGVHPAAVVTFIAGQDLKTIFFCKLNL